MALKGRGACPGTPEVIRSKVGDDLERGQFLQADPKDEAGHQRGHKSQPEILIK